MLFISLAIILISFIATCLPYFSKFPVLADETKDFANFGSYVGGVLSPIFTSLTLIVLIGSLMYQHMGISQVSKDNRNNLLLPKTFEALDFSCKELFKFLDDDISGHQTCLSTGVVDLTPQVSIYILFYDPEKIPEYLKLAPKLGKGTISRNLSQCINHFERIAQIESSIVDMEIPYFCVERKVREVYGRFMSMSKLLRKYANDEQSKLLLELSHKYNDIGSRLDALEPAKIGRSFDY